MSRQPFAKSLRSSGRSEESRGDKEIGTLLMSSEKKIVAVVDDDPEMRAAMVSLLSTLGYSPKTFDSAEAFLVCAPTSKAHCLVVDIQLPDITGIELAYQLAADGIKVPVIFMTGLDDELTQVQAVGAGGVALLHKPFSAKLLNDAIGMALG
ncbi:MAG TPA: response regulator [Pseudolabrys sp.]|nr:response regulator [Pseudolabrys sp.]